jgi:hypothetical protein
MTPQEAQMLQDLVRKVQDTELTEKDPDADALLKDGLARDPDAIYKLAQTVLIQNLALEQARAQMQRMQQQLTAPQQQQQPARATSFLGGLFHHNAPQSAPGSTPPPPNYAPNYGQGYAPGYAPNYGRGAPYQAGPVYQGPPPAYAPGYAPSSGGGGFLRSAATTAAGVAGGMLAFEGLESMLHHGMGGGGFGGFGGGMPVEETVINNYYDNPEPGQGGWEQGQNFGGPNEQPQGPFNAGDQGTAQDYMADAGDPGQGDDQGYLADSGGDFDSGQDFADDSGGDFGGDGSDFV